MGKGMGRFTGRARARGSGGGCEVGSRIGEPETDVDRGGETTSTLTRLVASRVVRASAVPVPVPVHDP